MAGSMDADDDLLRAWAGGDSEAGNALFERHFAVLYRFFEHKVPPPFDDLVQRTMLLCIDARDRFRGDSSFRAFLLGIARNVLLQHIERSAREGQRIDWGTRTARDGGASPSAALAAHDDRRRLVLAMQRLPLEQQMTLELYFWEGLSAPEVARALEITEPAVRSRLRRAIERLREDFAGSEGQGDGARAEVERWNRGA